MLVGFRFGGEKRNGQLSLIWPRKPMCGPASIRNLQKKQKEIGLKFLVKVFRFTFWTVARKSKKSEKRHGKHAENNQRTQNTIRKYQKVTKDMKIQKQYCWVETDRSNIS